MKKCQRCGHENADAMRFCLECGTPLADAPMIINIGGQTQNQSGVKTDSFGQSVQTQVGNQNFPGSFPVTPQAKKRGGGKILLAVGGIFALLFLFAFAGAAILYYNWKQNNEIVSTPTPTPTRTPKTLSSGNTKPTPKDSPEASPEDTPEDSPSPAADSDKSAQFKKMWVDYDVSEKGRKGMRIHADFSVFHMKGIESYWAVYFQQEDGTKLTTGNRAYASKDGQVAIYKLLKPNFDPETEYKDLQIFMPYDELKLSAGSYKLTMDSDLIYKGGDLIQHMDFHNFEYDKE